MIKNYFSNLFSSAETATHPITSKVAKKVTDHQKHDLLKPYEPEEIEKTILSMHPDKSLGLDSFNPGFYQRH